MQAAGEIPPDIADRIPYRPHESFDVTELTVDQSENVLALASYAGNIDLLRLFD